MNRPQKIFVLIAVAVVALVLLFPPWKYVELKTGDNVERDAGYGLLFSPPSLKNHAAVMDAFSVPKSRTELPRSTINANNTTLWGNVNGRYGPIYTPTPTPEPPRVVPNDIDESDYQVRLDVTSLAVQCAVVAVLAFGAYVVLSRKSDR